VGLEIVAFALLFYGAAFWLLGVVVGCALPRKAHVATIGVIGITLAIPYYLGVPQDTSGKMLATAIALARFWGLAFGGLLVGRLVRRGLNKGEGTTAV
jgi:hypothetical protein